MYAVHHGLAPSYITELMTSAATQTSRPKVRSADTTNVQPRIWPKFRERAFSHASPAAWNSLPDELRQKHTLSTVSNVTSTF